jgi:hypothetical protein
MSDTTRHDMMHATVLLHRYERYLATYRINIRLKQMWLVTLSPRLCNYSDCRISCEGDNFINKTAVSG